ncbi:MAG UNVERIFIED_CONTAM: alpha/beta hydrolase [Planctomycetaceae bacterium]|jgi:acetyl esterase/lipase
MRALAVLLLILLTHCTPTLAQQKLENIPYRENGHPRHVLDVYCPEQAAGQKRPVLFWIHGGGWQAGDKSDVDLKPKVAYERGMVFVAANYRLLPTVTMEELTDDVAAALGWVRRHIADHGGDPDRIIVGGHSAGAQLAALLCTDGRWIERHGVSMTALKGCIPVDGDTYDIPKIIATAEHRQILYGGKMFTYGHRQKFGNDPEKHVSFSAVTHVAPDRGIPPFLILYFTGNPDTTVQARRLADELQQAGISAKAFGKGDSNHSQLNNDLGKPEDPATVEFLGFLDRVTAGSSR